MNRLLLISLITLFSMPLLGSEADAKHGAATSVRFHSSLSLGSQAEAKRRLSDSDVAARSDIENKVRLHIASSFMSPATDPQYSCEADYSEPSRVTYSSDVIPEPTVFKVNIDEKLAKQSIATFSMGRLKRMIDDFMEGIGPKNFVFYGPPGTGKSTLAKSLAHLIGRINHCYSFPAAFIVNQYQGSGSENILKVFSKIAQLNKPCVIIIDELQLITEHKRSNQILGALWTALDLFEHSDVVVICTMNKGPKLPKQVKERFVDGSFEIALPDEKQREFLVKYFREHNSYSWNTDARDKRTYAWHASASDREVAKLMKNCPTRRIEKIIKEAASLARDRARSERNNNVMLTLDDFKKALANYTAIEQMQNEYETLSHDEESILLQRKTYALHQLQYELQKESFAAQTSPEHLAKVIRASVTAVPTAVVHSAENILRETAVSTVVGAARILPFGPTIVESLAASLNSSDSE